MEEQILQKLTAQEQRLDAIYKSLESARKFFFATMIMTIVMSVLPFIGLLFIVPWVLGVMGNVYNGIL